MDKTIIKKLKKYAHIISKKLPVKKIILYGSYAKGLQTENSDIDIAVVLEKIPGDYLNISAELFNLVRDIDFRIEPILINEKNDRSGFLESILKYGKIIYKT